MRVDQIGLLQGAAAIKSVTLRQAEKPEKWKVEFKHKNGDIITLTAQRQNVRQFASIDAAWKAIASLGFTEAHIEWKGFVPKES